MNVDLDPPTRCEHQQHVDDTVTVEQTRHHRYCVFTRASIVIACAPFESITGPDPRPITDSHNNLYIWPTFVYDARRTSPVVLAPFPTPRGHRGEGPYRRPPPP